MGSRPLFADPGGEVVGAPIGSEAWAQRVRLEMQAVVKDLGREPERFERYHALCNEHRLWTLLNKRDGSRFATWPEFCAYEQPWGLGTPWDRIEPFVTPVLGKQAVQLMTAAPDARVNNRRGGHVDSGTGCPNQTSDRSTKNLRAILRAPQPVQELYRAGLIGQKEAAKLGPDRPTPDQAARIAEVTAAIRSTTRPELPIERPRVQREVNERVRSMLGAKASPLARIESLAWSMSLADLAAAIPLLTSIHAERAKGAQRPRRRAKP